MGNRLIGRVNKNKHGEHVDIKLHIISVNTYSSHFVDLFHDTESYDVACTASLNRTNVHKFFSATMGCDGAL